jgi:ubiquitin C-terminal hydrolase
MNKVKHNLSESYLQSLTEEQRLNEMKEWSASEWQQYYCPNGTISAESFFEKLDKRVQEMVFEKYGSDNIK